LWDWGLAAPRRDDVLERAAVCRRASTLCPHKFFMLLPKAPTNLSVTKVLDLSGRLVEDLRQVSSTLKRVCAAAWNPSFENGVDRKAPLCTRICPCPFFEATPLGAAPRPPVQNRGPCSSLPGV